MMLAFAEYQDAAIATAVYPEDYPSNSNVMGLIYCVLKLNGEAGELAESVGKSMRDENFLISVDRRHKLLLELGDVLWYITNAAKELNSTLEEVAILNAEKVSSRKARDVVHGSGDLR